MQLPNLERAEISAEKLRDYLLSETHPVGRFKYKFFSALGYTALEWQSLERDIRVALVGSPARPVGDDKYGTRYAVSCMLKGPNGESAMVQTLWLIPRGFDSPSFITAYPNR
jgi:hypothetical protein